MLCRRWSGYWEAALEHDGELASDGVPFAHRALPFGGRSIKRQIDQFRRRIVAGEMAPGADGPSDLRVQGIDGVRGVDQFADLGRIIEERTDLVPGPPPAWRDRRVSFGQIAVLEFSQGLLGRTGIHRRVDRLEGVR